MARPTKAALTYFSLDVDMDDKVSLVEAKHGIVGFGVLIKLLQSIYRNGYYLHVTEEWLLLLKKQIDVDIAMINSVIDDALRWEFFDSDLMDKYGILTSRGVQKRYIEATKRRKDVEFIGEYLLLDDVSSLYKNGVNVYINSINADINPENVDINSPEEGLKGINVDKNSKNADNNRQSKVKESKVKKRKTPYSPPRGIPKTTEFFKDYLSEKISGTDLSPYADKLNEFIDYRMGMPKRDRYRSERGIDGLIRDVTGCLTRMFDIPTCLDITMERDWKTPSPDYFKNNPTTSKPESLSEYRKRIGETE